MPKTDDLKSNVAAELGINIGEVAARADLMQKMLFSLGDRDSAATYNQVHALTSYAALVCVGLVNPEQIKNSDKDVEHLCLGVSIEALSGLVRCTMRAAQTIADQITDPNLVREGMDKEAATSQTDLHELSAFLSKWHEEFSNKGKVLYEQMKREGKL